MGGMAQLARAPALQAGGHRFEPDILHYIWRWSKWLARRSHKSEVACSTHALRTVIRIFISVLYKRWTSRNSIK